MEIKSVFSDGYFRAPRLMVFALSALPLVGCVTALPEDSSRNSVQTTTTIAAPPTVDEATAAPTPVVSRALIVPDQQLKTCPGMRVSNAPPATDRIVDNYVPLILLQGVQLMTAPVKNACLSSGFGPRGSRQRLHKGVDYHQRPAKAVYAAGAGVVLERQFRNDYGNMILIDHGNGVYTRYAHLANFASGTEIGKKLLMGSELGIMGNTGAPPAVHLHYEVLTGDYNNPKRSFGLTARNPFK